MYRSEGTIHELGAGEWSDHFAEEEVAGLTDVTAAAELVSLEIAATVRRRITPLPRGPTREQLPEVQRTCIRAALATAVHRSSPKPKADLVSELRTCDM